MQSEKQQNFYMFKLNNNRKINNYICVRQFASFKINISQTRTPNIYIYEYLKCYKNILKKVSKLKCTDV